MKIYDISQELFRSSVYPGDVPPTAIKQLRMERGDVCNVTVLTMCAHNGTHMDAPYHFYEDGKTIDQMDLNKCIGMCSVVNFFKQPGISEVENILKKSEKKLLLKGNVFVTLEMAELFHEYNIELIGVEGQSVGPVGAPREVHLSLLKNEVVILEGIRLGEVEEGDYLLSAAPINMGGIDGAPCRAVLLEL